jgi:DNA-binding transcriptional regulator YbjK
MDATATPVRYQGRKTSRAGSEQRRRFILEAALRIVVRDGVRGIRHRSVAKEAEVPLAATTYYFKDIDELISDTFIMYAEKARDFVFNFSRKMYEPLEKADGKKLAEMTTGDRLVEIVSEQMTEYVVSQATTYRDDLIAEQAFRHEALLNPDLRKLAQSHQAGLDDMLFEFLNLLAPKKHPKEDIKIIVATLHRLEYEALLMPIEKVTIDVMYPTISRQMQLILSVHN